MFLQHSSEQRKYPANTGGYDSIALGFPSIHIILLLLKGSTTFCQCVPMKAEEGEIKTMPKKNNLQFMSRNGSGRRRRKRRRKRRRRTSSLELMLQDLNPEPEPLKLHGILPLSLLQRGNARKSHRSGSRDRRRSQDRSSNWSQDRSRGGNGRSSWCSEKSRSAFLAIGSPVAGGAVAVRPDT